MNNINVLQVVTALILVILTSCGLESTGNTSDTGNARIAGVIYESEGTGPAAGVGVALYADGFLAAAGSAEVSVADSTVTGEDGRFLFEDIPAGAYVVSAVRTDEGALIAPVEIKEKSVVDLRDTLRALGAIRGEIAMESIEGEPAALVLVYGMDRFIPVEGNGTFLLDSLPSGVYRLKVVPALSGYSVFDIDSVVVTAGETTDLGRRVTPVDGIPAPERVSVEWDMMKRKATIRWSPVESPAVAGYSIFVREQGTGTSFDSVLQERVSRIRYYLRPLIFGPTLCITDTVFVDSLSDNENSPVTYFVASVDTAGNIGRGTPGNTILTRNCFEKTVFDLPFEAGPDGELLSDVANGADGNLYMLRKGEVLVVNSELQVENTFCMVEGYDADRITVDNDGTVYLTRRRPGAVFKYAADGTLTDSITGDAFGKYGVFDVEASDGKLYCITGGSETFTRPPLPEVFTQMQIVDVDGGDSVAVFDPDGTFLTAWECSEHKTAKWISKCGNGEVAVSDLLGQGCLQVYDSDGNAKRRLCSLDSNGVPPLPGDDSHRMWMPGCLSYDVERDLLYMQRSDGSSLDHLGSPGEFENVLSAGPCVLVVFGKGIGTYGSMNVGLSMNTIAVVGNDVAVFADKMDSQNSDTCSKVYRMQPGF